MRGGTKPVIRELLSQLQCFSRMRQGRGVLVVAEAEQACQIDQNADCFWRHAVADQDRSLLECRARALRLFLPPQRLPTSVRRGGCLDGLPRSLKPHLGRLESRYRRGLVIGLQRRVAEHEQQPATWVVVSYQLQRGSYVGERVHRRELAHCRSGCRFGVTRPALTIAAAHEVERQVRDTPLRSCPSVSR